MKYLHLLMSLVISFAVRLLLFLLFFITHSSFLAFGPAWVQEFRFCSREYTTRISIFLEYPMALALDILVLGSPVVFSFRPILVVLMSFLVALSSQLLTIIFVFLL